MATADVYQRQSEDEEDQVLLVDKTESSNEQQSLRQYQTWLLKQTGLSTTKDLFTLVKLDLPNCNLTSLPDNLPTLCPNLEILFCPQNKFQQVPAIIGKCLKLRMISFKNCYTITTIHPDALQSQLQWLILTGNKLTTVPETIGRCLKLQKCMLSGNCLKGLPNSMIKLQKLELIRLACNQLEEPPMDILSSLESLKWIAFASNPFIDKCRTTTNTDAQLPILDDPVLEDNTWPILGQGAGGITRKVVYDGRTVAVKTFVGQLTSDGSPQDEKSISVKAATLQDPALIQLIGETHTSGALVMEFLQDYIVLANPPSFDTCTRDVYNDNVINLISTQFGYQICCYMLRVLQKLHSVGICHGDFYAHNILIQPKQRKVKLSDFGASFFYDPTGEYGKYAQQLELRSYTVLVNELYDLLMKSNTEKDSELDIKWKALLEECQKPNTTFDDLVKQFL